MMRMPLPVPAPPTALPRAQLRGSAACVAPASPAPARRLRAWRSSAPRAAAEESFTELPFAPSPLPPSMRSAHNPLRPHETVEQAQRRRAAETAGVEARITRVADRAALDRELAGAGERLVMLEIVSDQVCDPNGEPRPEAQWKDEDAASDMGPCVQLRSGLQRVARDCPDVVFLSVNADEPASAALVDALDTSVFPTIQFYRRGALLWQTEGTDAGLQNTGEAVLYFADTAADGVRASDYVSDVSSQEELSAFLAAAGPDTLAVLNVSLATATPCLKIFPAFMALARHLRGVGTFARLIGDAAPSARALTAALGVVEAPTFIFFRNGQEVLRHVGSSRGDLLGKILEVQGAMGVAPPPVARRRAQRVPASQAPARRASGQAMWR